MINQFMETYYKLVKMIKNLGQQIPASKRYSPLLACITDTANNNMNISTLNEVGKCQ